MADKITLEQLYELQKKLDARIIKEKGLEGQDLLPNTVLALQVEIAELANEWRGFKHWSNDRQPRTKVDNGICFECGGTGDAEIKSMMMFLDCDKCNGTGREYANRLLEEYADCLHFFLSIALQLDLLVFDLYQPDEELENETSLVFIELLHTVGMISGPKFINDPEWIKPVEWFKTALYMFYSLGEQRLGFDFDQIAAAYLEKNKVNHNRQSNGY